MFFLTLPTMMLYVVALFFSSVAVMATYENNSKVVDIELYPSCSHNLTSSF